MLKKIHLPSVRSSIKPLALTFAGFMHAMAVWAALDAGGQLQRYHNEAYERIDRPTTTGLTLQNDSPPEQARAASDETILINAFHVTGVMSLTNEEVATVLSPFTGKVLTTSDIHNAAQALNELYRSHGYFTAKVFIPPQQVTDAIIIDVYEGYLDEPAFEVLNDGERVHTEVIGDILQANIDVSHPMHREEFERALLLTEDLPGISTHSIIYPGAHVGTARLRTRVTDQAFFNGNIDFDNFGNRATGQGRLGTTMYFNSPSGAGDQIVTRFVTSGERSNYAYVNYLTPISATGTRFGASVDYLDYSSRYINNLGYSEGEAFDVRFYLTHPIIRSRHKNLAIRAELSQMDLDDRNDLNINADRKVRSATFTLHGDDDHPWLNTGLTNYSLSATTGYADIQGNDNYIVADRASTDTEGKFYRINLDASRLSRLSERWSFLTSIRGQFAEHDLDSSQRFYLGGASSISGFPVGEASGDSGAEYSLELRHDFVPPWQGTLTGGIFFQQGWLRMHQDTWVNWQGGNPLLENELTLSSAGLNVLSTFSNNWVVRGTLGWQVGDNSMRDPLDGSASDNRDNDYRGWVQAIRYF